jgi:hypothetical protein
MNNIFKSTAAVLTLVGALGATGQAQAVPIENVNVNWSAFQDVGGAFMTSGTIVSGSNTSILNSTLDTFANNTGYKVQFSIAGPLAIAGWAFDHTEWRASAGATAYGSATNNSGVTQTMDAIAGTTLARVGFNGLLANPGTQLANALSVATGSFGTENSSVEFVNGASIALSANPVTDSLGPWVSNNSLLAYARGNASNTQAGSGNVDFTMTNRANFYVEARHIYTQNANVPEPATLGLMGLGLAGFAAFRKRKQA